MLMLVFPYTGPVTISLVVEHVEYNGVRGKEIKRAQKEVWNTGGWVLWACDKLQSPTLPICIEMFRVLFNCLTMNKRYLFYCIVVSIE